MIIAHFHEQFIGGLVDRLQSAAAAEENQTKERKRDNVKTSTYRVSAAEVEEVTRPMIGHALGILVRSSTSFAETSRISKTRTADIAMTAIMGIFPTGCCIVTS